MPYVTTAALMEQTNRVEVRLTTDDANKVAQILRFDSIGGAIPIRCASESVKDDVLVKAPAQENLILSY